MHHPTDRTSHTLVTPVVKNLLEKEIAQWEKIIEDISQQLICKKAHLIQNKDGNVFI